MDQVAKLGVDSNFTIVVADGPISRPIVQALTAAVYPPEVLERVPWRNIRSSPARTRIMIVNDEREVVAAAGLLIRDALLDGAPVRIGGIGGVMTSPPLQRRGLGRLAMQAVQEEMLQDASVDFGLLFCEEKNVPFYSGMGWSVFEGTVQIEQPEGRRVYDIMRAMVLTARIDVPTRGSIDVCGYPW